MLHQIMSAKTRSSLTYTVCVPQLSLNAHFTPNSPFLLFIRAFPSSYLHSTDNHYRLSLTHPSRSLISIKYCVDRQVYMGLFCNRGRSSQVNTRRERALQWEAARHLERTEDQAWPKKVLFSYYREEILQQSKMEFWNKYKFLCVKAGTKI